MSVSSGASYSVDTVQMRPFDLRVIERELRDLWKEKSEEDASKQSGIMRACVLNFFIYEDQTIASGQLMDTILDVTRHHPSRVVVMGTQANSLRDGLQAEVTAICHFIPGRGKQVCSEQVNIFAEGSAVKHLAASVIPLVVSDLPVVVWWRGMPTDGEPFISLISTADRVIVDSNYSRNPTLFLSVLAVMVHDRFEAVAFSDLNWARLTPLRSHIAGLFDVPDLRAYLRDTTKLTIEYPLTTADGELPAPQAMLLVGWFASRLNWHTNAEVLRSKNGRYIINLPGSTREVTIELLPVVAMGDGDLRVTLTMTDSSGWQEARMQILQRFAHNAIETKLETPTICWLKDVARYEMPQEGELLSRELEILGHDRIYEMALACAAQFVEQM
jgi:glucose-6-phosphate dehydrogenase assembly protein OpcA